MKISELQAVFDRILANTQDMVVNGQRNRILNERYYHHQFSHHVARHFERQGIDPWASGIIVPEHPTLVKYAWKEFGLNRPKTTARLAINRGQSANFDFVIKDAVPIFVEWKGPGLYEERAVAQDLAKLLMIKNQRSPKIFAAIITSAQRADERHIRELTTRFYGGLKFVREVLGIKNVSQLKKANLYAFIATVPDDGAQKFIWGKI